MGTSQAAHRVDVTDARRPIEVSDLPLARLPTFAGERDPDHEALYLERKGGRTYLVAGDR